MKKFLSTALVAGLLATGAVAATAPTASAAVYGCSVSGPTLNGATAQVTNLSCTRARVVVKYVSYDGSVKVAYGAWVNKGGISRASAISDRSIISVTADGGL